MTQRPRRIVAAAAAAAVFVLGLVAIAGLPPYGAYAGPYGTVLNVVAPHERKIENIITAVNFDYRGLDTMGEEYILFAAVAGIAMVLRNDRRRTTSRPLATRRVLHGPASTDAMRAAAVLSLAVTIAFGGYLAIHAAQTPGGGFQGGAILAGFAPILILGLGYPVLRRLVPQDRFEAVEAAGAAAYAIIGIATLLAAGAFLENVLPLGGAGDLFSSGTIAVINLCVGAEVCAGFFLLFLEFAHETRVEDTEHE